MSSHPELAATLERVARAEAEAASGGRMTVVLIDGPAGAGKSTLADVLVANWPASTAPTLVRMDDLYPGWDGLDAGSRNLTAELLLPLRRGGVGRWQRYNWAKGELDAWTIVDPSHPLIVEGCGTLSRANAPLADLRIWLTADDVVRKDRALARDHGGFDPYWDLWQRQFDAFVARETPLRLADLVLDVTDWPIAEDDG